jgi:hypothetical protein
VKTLLVGALSGGAVFVLLVTAVYAAVYVLVVGAYALRMTPEVINCDRGRQSVAVRVTNVSLDRDTSVVRREVGPCKLWFHTNP